MTKPINRPPLPKGRVPKQPSSDAAERITALAADGFSVRGVAAGLGISENILRRWFDEEPELKEAFDQGREQERHHAADAVRYGCLRLRREATVSPLRL